MVEIKFFQSNFEHLTKLLLFQDRRTETPSIRRQFACFQHINQQQQEKLWKQPQS